MKSIILLFANTPREVYKLSIGYGTNIRQKTQHKECAQDQNWGEDVHDIVCWSALFKHVKKMLT